MSIKKIKPPLNQATYTRNTFSHGSIRFVKIFVNSNCATMDTIVSLALLCHYLDIMRHETTTVVFVDNEFEWPRTGSGKDADDPIVFSIGCCGQHGRIHPHILDARFLPYSRCLDLTWAILSSYTSPYHEKQLADTHKSLDILISKWDRNNISMSDLVLFRTIWSNLIEDAETNPSRSFNTIGEFIINDSMMTYFFTERDFLCRKIGKDSDESSEVEVFTFKRVECENHIKRCITTLLELANHYGVTVKKLYIGYTNVSNVSLVYAASKAHPQELQFCCSTDSQQLMTSLNIQLSETSKEEFPEWKYIEEMRSTIDYDSSLRSILRNEIIRRHLLNWRITLQDSIKFDTSEIVISQNEESIIQKEEQHFTIGRSCDEPDLFTYATYNQYLEEMVENTIQSKQKLATGLASFRLVNKPVTSCPIWRYVIDGVLNESIIVIATPYVFKNTRTEKRWFKHNMSLSGLFEFTNEIEKDLISSGSPWVCSICNKDDTIVPLVLTKSGLKIFNEFKLTTIFDRTLEIAATIPIIVWPISAKAYTTYGSSVKVDTYKFEVVKTIDDRVKALLSVNL